MMSYKQWLVLFVIYILFMLVGSVVFMYLEIDNELADRQDLLDLKKRVIDVISNLTNETKPDVEDILFDISGSCGHDFLQLGEDEPITWSLWNSFFFTFTVITTIGFGHMSPSTPWGKVFCILYATVGVPLNGIVIATLADFFSTKVVNSRVRARAKRYQSSWLAVASDAICYLLPGFVILLVIPSAILFAVEEGWDYLDSFYYAFITLTTIGFGDYVAGRQETDYVLVWLYKIISFIWIIFGLGYIIVTVTFIQKALKSKKVHNIERRMAKVLKKHASKMNENVNHDLKRLRKIVNTLSVLNGESDPHQEENPEVQSEEKKKQKEQQALEQEAGYDTANAERTFHSHHDLPFVKRESLKRMYSSSDAEFNLSKNELIASKSLGNINIFLDMVETLMKEHEEDAAKRAADEARQFMEDTADASNDSSSTNSDEETETPMDGKKQRDLEAGFINFVCTGDDDKIIFEKDKAKNIKGDENRNTHLQRRLSTFLGVPALEGDDSCAPTKSVSAERIPKASDLIGMMESFVNQSLAGEYGAFSNLVNDTRRVSSTVPGRYKYIECENRVQLKDMFQKDVVDDPNETGQPKASHSKDEEDPHLTIPSLERRRWSVGDPCASQISQNLTDDLFEDTKGSKIEPFRIKKWIHSDSDPESKSDSEDSAPEYSRL